MRHKRLIGGFAALVLTVVAPAATDGPFVVAGSLLA